MGSMVEMRNCSATYGRHRDPSNIENWISISSTPTLGCLSKGIKDRIVEFGCRVSNRLITFNTCPTVTSIPLGLTSLRFTQFPQITTSWGPSIQMNKPVGDFLPSNHNDQEAVLPFLCPGYHCTKQQSADHVYREMNGQRICGVYIKHYSLRRKGQTLSSDTKRLNVLYCPMWKELITADKCDLVLPIWGVSNSHR